MISPPQIIQSEFQRTATLHVVVPRERIKEVMGPGVGELFSEVVSQGIAVTGPWFTYHHHIPNETFDFDIGVPVAAEVKPSGRVRPNSLPALKIARTVYQGEYEGLAEAWEAFMDWMIMNGLTPGPNFWESYVTGPDVSENPGDWRTELNRSII
ncbi:MAG: GyrI-like domain-containing protein [Cyanobacteria bacterium]|nr:GyrI-like domain-containing protein [Cyanobacteriota bacterium]